MGALFNLLVVAYGLAKRAHEVSFVAGVNEPIWRLAYCFISVATATTSA